VTIPSLRHVGIGFGVLATTLLIYDAFKIVRALRASADPSMHVAPFETHPEDVNARLLVLGDSTAVGTGAGRSTQSVAGRLAEAHPGLLVDNRAHNGARVRDLRPQLDDVELSAFDVVLLQVGGNDILRWTPLKALRQALDDLLAQVTDRAGEVIVIAPGMVGDAPAIPWPLGHLLNARSKRVRSIVRDRATEHGAVFVDLRAAKADRKQAPPHERYAADGLHPSARGYAAWYRALLAQTPVRNWLEAARAE